MLGSTTSLQICLNDLVAADGSILTGGALDAALDGADTLGETVGAFVGCVVADPQVGCTAVELQVGCVGCNETGAEVG